jgi:hypothetical protein
LRVQGLALMTPWVALVTITTWLKRLNEGGDAKVPRVV